MLIDIITTSILHIKNGLCLDYLGGVQCNFYPNPTPRPQVFFLRPWDGKTRVSFNVKK